MEGSVGSKPSASFEFEVEKIIGASDDGRYQVQWKPAWVSKFHLVGCQHLIQQFMQQQERSVVKHEETVVEDLCGSNECDKKYLKFMRIMQGLVSSSSTSENNLEQHQLPTCSESTLAYINSQRETGLLEYSSSTAEIVQCISHELPSANFFNEPNKQQSDSVMCPPKDTMTENIQAEECNFLCLEDAELLENSSSSTAEIVQCISHELPAVNFFSEPNKQQSDSVMCPQKDTTAESNQTEECNFLRLGEAGLVTNSSSSTAEIIQCISHELPAANFFSEPNKQQSDSGMSPQKDTTAENNQTEECNFLRLGEAGLVKNSTSSTDEIVQCISHELPAANFFNEPNKQQSDSVMCPQKDTMAENNQTEECNFLPLRETGLLENSSSSTDEIVQCISHELPAANSFNEPNKQQSDSGMCPQKDTTKENIQAEECTFLCLGEAGLLESISISTDELIQIVCHEALISIDLPPQNNTTAEHIQTESEEHTCPHCCKLISEISARTQHVDIQENLELFSCHHCGRFITRKDNISMYEPTQVGELSTGDVCGESVSQICMTRVNGVSVSQKSAVEMEGSTSRLSLECVSTNIEKNLRVSYHLRSAIARNTLSSKDKHQSSSEQEGDNELSGQTNTKPRRNISTGGKKHKQKSSQRNQILINRTVKYRSSAHCSRNLVRNVTTHLEQLTGRPIFACSHCDKTFTKNSALKTHVLTHTREKRFSCNICPNSFSRKIDLKKHIKRTHKKDFLCEMCGKSFAGKKSLDSHLRKCTHSGKKAFSCETHGKSFEWKKTLSANSCIRNEVKSYQCEVCGKEYTNYTSKVEHRRRKHGLEKILFVL